MNENENEQKPKVSLGLLYGIIIAIVAGAIIGGYAPDLAVHTTILGEVFLNLLKMIVVPLVVLSMIVGDNQLRRHPQHRCHRRTNRPLLHGNNRYLSSLSG